MWTLFSTLLLLTSLLVPLFAASGTAAAGPAPVTECMTISTSGTYTLGSNITGGSYNCINVTADDVTIDGAGYWINGTGGVNDAAIFVDGVSDSDTVDNVTVQDVVLDGWSSGYGVWAEYTHDTTLQGIRTSNNEYGVYLYATVRTTVTGLQSSMDDYGVWDSLGRWDTVQDSTFFRPTYNGVQLSDAKHTTVDNNTVLEDGGIYANDGYQNVITNNTIEGDLYGTNALCNAMGLSREDGAHVDNNTVSECYDGGSITDSTNVVYRDNLVQSNENGGLTVDGGSNVQLLNNTFDNNDQDWNTVQEGLHLRGTEHAVLRSNTITGNYQDLFVEGSLWPTLDHDIDTSNLVGGQPVHYLVNQSSALVSGSAGYVALINSDGATVQDVSPAGNYRGIFLWRTTDATVTNVSVSDSQFGLWLDESSDNLLVEGSTFTGSTVNVLNSANLALRNSTFDNADGVGVSLNTAPNAVFNNITVTRSDRTGIELKSGSDNVLITGSNVSSNSGTGVYIYHSYRTTVQDSTLSSNSGSGVAVGSNNVHNVTVAGSTLTGNSGDGVRLSTYGRDNTITSNTITDNGGDGIQLGSSGWGDTVAGNTILGHASGLNLPSTFDDLLVYDNRFNNTANVAFSDPAAVTNATWNTTPTTGTNILGGSVIAGNYWANATGTGFSQTCTDSEPNGLCDTSYTLDTNQTDLQPLAASGGGGGGGEEGPSAYTSPSNHDYGTVTVDTNASQTFSVSNEGNTAFNITSIGLAGADASQFTIVGGGGTPVSVGSMGSHGIDVNFTPSNTSSYSAVLAVRTDHPDANYTWLNASLAGTGGSGSGGGGGGGGGGTPAVYGYDVTYLSGPNLTGTPTADVSIWGGLLQVQLEAGMDGSSVNYDLGAYGANANSTWRINGTLSSYVPRLLLGAGNVSSYTFTENQNGTYNFSIVATPIASDILWVNNTTPTPQNWPQGDNDTATDHDNFTVSFAIDEMAHVANMGQDPNLFNGTVLATDAQYLGTPQYDSFTNTLSLMVGAPHYEPDGQTVNDGYYRAFIPSALLTDWSVSSPSDLTGAYQGSNESILVDTGHSGGWWIDVPLHYSSGSVNISAGGGGGGNFQMPNVEVTSTNVDVVGRDVQNLPSVNATGNFVSVDFQLENSTGGLDLSEYNITPQDTLEVNLTLRNFTNVSILMGRGLVQSYANTTNNDGTTNLTVRVEPIQMAFIDDCTTYNRSMGFCGPTRVSNWPTNASEDVADVNIQAGVKLMIVDLAQVPGFPQEEKDKLEGMFLTTDAQALGFPKVVTNNGSKSLVIGVAAPHLLPDESTVNQGVFEAFMPPAFIQDLNISNPDELAGSYQGQDMTMTVQSRNGGLYVKMTGLHYSSGNVTLSKDTEAPTANAGSDQTVDEDTQVSFNGSASTDNVGVDAYNWSFGDGSTATGATPTHTYADPGTYTVTLNVTDAAGNYATDTLTVTVQDVQESSDSGSSDPEPQPDPVVTNVTVSATSLQVGEDLTVTATVENQGEGSGTMSVTFRLDDGELRFRTLSLAPSETGTASVTHAYDVADTYTVTVGGVHGGTVTVTDPTAGSGDDDPQDDGSGDGNASLEPDLRVVDATLTPNNLTVGETVEACGTVVNDGTAEGNLTVEVALDDGTVHSESVTLAPGASQDLCHTFTVPHAGNFSVSLDGVPAGTLTVQDGDDAPSDQGEGETPGTDETPGFTLALALVGLLGAARVLRRRD